ncbi:MAG: thiamine diphosphokinase [Eubacterium sp.]|nr:thiamine diphosphokinase [Eubacterium sp.]
MENRICYIFGAGERSGCEISLSPEDFVIAADGGFDYLNDLGLRADVVLGDFDSVLSYELPSDSIRFPREKDDTDMMLAVKLGLEKGYREFAIYGGLGGRLDHTLANLQVLVYLSRNEACGTLYSDNYAIRVISDGTISFGKDHPANVEGNLCSVFSVSDVSVKVTIHGLKYEINDVNLTNSFPLGISNEFTGKKAYINVKKGTIAALWYLPRL